MADTAIATNVTTTLRNKRGVTGPYWLSDQIGAWLYINSSNDLSTIRTEDGGSSRSAATYEAGSVATLSSWFDRDTPGNTGTLIHVVWIDDDTDAFHYNSFDIQANSWGTERTVASSLTVNGGTENNRAAITRTAGGDLIAAFVCSSTNSGTYRSTDGGANWSSIANVFESNTRDTLQLFPAATVANEDAAALFHDNSADELSVKMYDQSANSWTETVLSTGIANLAQYDGMDGAVRHSDGHLLVAAHTNINNVADDLVTWDIAVDSIASPTVTSTANIYTNQDESGEVRLFLDQQRDEVYAIYLKGGTWESSVTPVYHVSANGMTSWGAEQTYGAGAGAFEHIGRTGTVGDDGGRFQPTFYDSPNDDLWTNLDNDLAIAACATSISFPAQVDSFVNPTANATPQATNHAGQHANANDSITAIEQFLLGRDTAGAAVTVPAGRWPLARIVPPPAIGDFTWVNKGTGADETLTSELFSGFSMRRGSTSSGNSALVRSLPGTDYTVTALISAPVLPRSWMGAGLCWRESSSGKLVTFGPFGDGTNGTGLAVKKYTAPSTWSADYIWEKFPVGPYMVLQIQKSGANRIASFSLDGHNFVTWHSVSNTDFMTPDQIGVFVQPQQDVTPKFDVSVAVLSWEEVDDS